MLLRYRYRVYPTAPQRAALAGAFGCARVVYNDAVAARKHAYTQGLPYPTTARLSKSLITEAKQTPERAWLAEVSAVVLQQALADADQAFKNFFASILGKRAGARVGPPRFKRRTGTQAIRFTRNARFRVTNGGRLRLPKIGELKVSWSRDLPAEPTSVTVLKTPTGKYYASFVVAVEDGADLLEPLADPEAETGIDLGLKDFAVLRGGKVIESPRFFRQLERKLKNAQRSLARKVKGSANRAKARVRVAKIYEQIKDTRSDWVNKQVKALVGENQALYVEDLHVKGLCRGRHAKSVHDAASAYSSPGLNLRRPGPGERSSRLTGTSPRPDCAPNAGPLPDRRALMASKSGRGNAGAAHTTIGTGTPRSTSGVKVSAWWPPGGRTPETPAEGR